jgi:hypothetical protein
MQATTKNEKFKPVNTPPAGDDSVHPLARFIDLRTPPPPRPPFKVPDTRAALREVLKHSKAPWVSNGEVFHMGNLNAANIDFSKKALWVNLDKGRYFFDLSRINESGWVEQLSGKTWIEYDSLVMLHELTWLFARQHPGRHSTHHAPKAEDTAPTMPPLVTITPTMPTLDLPQWMR